MRLCFGTFANILNCCKQRLPQDKFVSRVAWVIDAKNSSLGSGLDFEVSDDDLATMEGNPSVVSKLLSCKRALNIRDTYLPPIEVAYKRFKDHVMPFIDEDKAAKGLLAVRYIIDKDITIDTEHKESFRKYMGVYKKELLQQTKFDAPDFLTRVLLYTTCVDNKDGRPYVDEITDDFIENVANDSSWAELKWDVDTQTVEIIPSTKKRLLDALSILSEILTYLTKNQVSYTNMEWLGVYINEFLSGVYQQIKCMAPDKKRELINKLQQQRSLMQEFIDCLPSGQRLAMDQSVTWSVFLEKAWDIYQQITNLSKEISALTIVRGI